MRNLRVVCVLTVAVWLAGCNLDPRAAARTYLASGNKYFKNGKYKQARIMYLKAIAKDKLLGEAYYQEALCEMELGQPLAALRGFHRAVELQPDNYDAYGRLANLYLAAYLGGTKHPRQFVDEMDSLQKKLLAKDKNSYQGLRIRGYVELTREQVKESIVDFEKANSIKPNQQDVLIALVQALAADNRFDEAEKLARKAIQDNKSFAGLYDVLYVEFIKRNRIADAEAVVREKVEANPANVDYRLGLAIHYYAAHDRSKVDQTLQDILARAKDFPDVRKKVGDFYFRIRDFQPAYDQYQLGIKEDPKSRIEFELRMVEALVALGKHVEANQLVDRILEEDSKQPSAQAMRAALMLQAGGRENIQKAALQMQALVSKMPENAVLRYNYGRALLSRGDPDQAEVQFQEAVKIRPDYLLPRLALAEIAFNKRQYGKAIQITDEVVQLDPTDAIARLIRAKAQTAIGQSKQAREELKNLIKTYPNLLDAKFQIAQLDAAEKNYKEADTAFETLFKGTGDTRVLMAYTESLMAQQRYGDARKLIQGELDKSPARADLRLALGNILLRGKDFDAAAVQYKTVADQNPTSSDVWMRLADVYQLKGESSKSVEFLRKAVQADPKDLRAALRLGVQLDLAGDKKSARELYETVLKTQPEQPVALNNLAFLLAEGGGDLDRALSLAERARQQLPEETDVADTLGWIYLKKNLSESALNLFAEIAKKKPENATYRYHLALALYQKGDKIQAKKEASAALSQKPNKDDEQKIRELISKLG